MVFGVYNFKNISFYWKCSKFNLHFKNAEKNSEKVFPFRLNCIWVGAAKLSLLRREYFWPTVNVLKNSPEILRITKRDFFELNCLHSVQWIWQKLCDSDFGTVWSHLPCCLSKGPLKRDILDIYLKTFFRMRNFGNKSAMRVVFLLKLFQSLSTFLKCRKKLRTSFSI